MNTLSVPSTPEKQILSSTGHPKKANTNSFIKSFSQINVHSQSPLNKEAYEILYPDLPQLESKLITPQKICDRLNKTTGTIKKCLFSVSKKELFKRITTNPIIMHIILKELSNGDLYRLSQTSNSLKNAILYDAHASNRFTNYMKSFHMTKENYEITPPSSPEKDETENSRASPNTKKHQDFWKVSKRFTMSCHYSQIITFRVHHHMNIIDFKAVVNSSY